MKLLVCYFACFSLMFSHFTGNEVFALQPYPNPWLPHFAELRHWCAVGS